MNRMSCVFWFVVLGISCCTTTASEFNRSSFPDGFLFGVGSAAYQYEGADFEDGKGASIWDNFSRQFPDKMFNRSTGDVALDFYHRYKDDVKLMKFLGFDTFRFSISWSRILPRGKLSGGVNKAGVAFYNNLINELLSNGIIPFVTIYHWDLPQELEDEYGGLLSPRIVDDYLDFAELCFKEFGGRVNHWITFNEPYVAARNGYDHGNMAPGRCSACVPKGCPVGNSATEPYIAAHNMLLAHAAAFRLYKQKYQETQRGEIGIGLMTHWFLPYSSSKEDISARQRGLDFMLGWFMSPLTRGGYPYSMRKYVHDRLPKFTPEQKEMVKGSFDFIGLSYYTGVYVVHNDTIQNKSCLTCSTDALIQLTRKNGQYIGERTGFENFRVYPKGLTDVLAYTKKKYNSPTIYILENGFADVKNTTTREKSISDTQRVNFYHRHLVALQKAIKNGVNVKGFFAWSFLDAFEWDSAFKLKYGLVFVDHNDGLKRYPKRSAFWFKTFLRADWDIKTALWFI